MFFLHHQGFLCFMDFIFVYHLSIYLSISFIWILSPQIKSFPEPMFMKRESCVFWLKGGVRPAPWAFLCLLQYPEFAHITTLSVLLRLFLWYGVKFSFSNQFSWYMEFRNLVWLKGGCQLILSIVNGEVWGHITLNFGHCKEAWKPAWLHEHWPKC